MRYKLGSHHARSNHPWIAQKEMAISPEAKVRHKLTIAK